MILNAPHPPLGSRVKVCQPETPYRLPPGLKDGDEVVMGQFDCGCYEVTKDGQRFRVPFTCIEHELRPWPSQARER